MTHTAYHVFLLKRIQSSFILTFITSRNAQTLHLTYTLLFCTYPFYMDL